SIPVSVKVVGVAAFRDCIYLKGITIPDSVTNIEHHAFSNCKSLKSITIPDSITAIEMATFIDCASLTGVKIPDSVTSIGWGAFSNCKSLTKITIPAGVKTIADKALGYCYDDNGDKKTTDFKIYCYSNTQAEAYAKSRKFSYVLLDKLPAFAKVTGFKVKSKTNVSANLQWNKNISADGYVLDKYDGSKWVTIKTFTSNANTSFNVTGLKASTTFKFRIKAYKIYDITTVYSAFTYLNANTRPYTTTGMKCSSKTNVSANLRWNKNISANGYVLDKYDGKKWVTIKTFTSNTNTSFNVTGLKASKTFRFRLRAFKNFGSVKEYSAFTYLNVNTRPYTTTGMKCS
ncbi:fibronectin type III domain-containing protein, partial [[Eubacterium] siraeum]